ncbi:hypothetical protein AAY473_021558 [Plecturocebus cupreus]
MRHHAQLILVFLVEEGFLLVGQAGVELPTSGDSPNLASQSAGIIGAHILVQDIYPRHPYSESPISYGLATRLTGLSAFVQRMETT